MLIEFSVSNYRSFRDKQTFSMVAAPRLGKKENIVKPNVVGEKLPNLLKVAAVYGPNASGKSNLIKALGMVNAITNAFPTVKDQPFAVSPFRFDSALANEPSRFEYHFLAEGQRYELILAITSERVIEEKLFAFPKGREALLYERVFESSGERYTFGESLEGGSAVHDVWRKLTSPGMLFISQAVANSSEELKQLRVPLEWLTRNLRAVSRNFDSLILATQSVAKVHPELKMDTIIPSFLREVDIPITKIDFELMDLAGDSAKARPEAPVSIDKAIKPIIDSLDRIKTTLTHKSALGDATFDISDESDGTRNLFGFSLPWFLMSNTAPPALTLVVDELDSSLHPKIVAKLIEMFLGQDGSSQLIFTTHDTHLMDTKLLRRDQFWLSERDINGATQLRSIHDFEGRDSEDVEKRYYEGRYRGLPILR